MRRECAILQNCLGHFIHWPLNPKEERERENRNRLLLPLLFWRIVSGAKSINIKSRRGLCKRIRARTGQRAAGEKKARLYYSVLLVGI